MQQVLHYVPNLDFQQIFSAPGQSLDIFIPSTVYTSTFAPLQGSQVWGARPYSPTSDIAAIATHLGIIFPQEKPKKTQPIVLFTSPSAMSFNSTNINLSDQIRVDEDLNLLGVVIKVFSTDPLPVYPSLSGFRITSQMIEEEFPFSIDVASYYFCSEYQPIPSLLTLDIKVQPLSHTEDNLEFDQTSIDYEKIHPIVHDFDCVSHYIQRDLDPQLTLPYNPTFCSNESLFDTFAVTFFGNNWNASISREKDKQEYIFRVHYDEKDIVSENISFSQFVFDENFIGCGNEKYSDLICMLLEPIEDFLPPPIEIHRITESEHSTEHHSDEEEEKVDGNDQISNEGFQ